MGGGAWDCWDCCNVRRKKEREKKKKKKEKRAVTSSSDQADLIITIENTASFEEDADRDLPDYVGRVAY